MSSISVVPDTDEVLVKRALAGDKSAFGQLVTRYERKVFALVMEMVRHREDAEDITQEVFVRAFFSLKNFRAESSFYTWLYRVAYNMTIDFKRRVARRPQEAVANIALDSQTSNIEPVANVQTPDELIEGQERQESIRQALSGISEEHRAVILLREIDGLSYDEIARVTGSARGTVMSRLHYARKHLQKALRGFKNAGQDSNSQGPNSPIEDSGTSEAVDWISSDGKKEREIKVGSRDLIESGVKNLKAKVLKSKVIEKWNKSLLAAGKLERLGTKI